MTNIVDFPKPDSEDVVWQCGCGCLSFWLREDGELQCVQCDAIVQADVGDWRVRLPELPEIIEETRPNAVKVTDLNESSAALSRVLSHADVDHTAIVLVIQKDGGLSTWGSIKTLEEADWMARRLEQAANMVTRIEDET